MIDRQTQALYRRKAQLIKALAHPLRLAVVDYLQDGERCVCHIAEHLGAERSNVSRHLAVMLKSGVLQCRKDGLMVYYELRTPCLADCLQCVSKALKQNIRQEARLLCSP